MKRSERKSRKKCFDSSEPAPTEEKKRSGLRALVTLGISALVFGFFFMLDMLWAAMVGSLAVMLLLTVFYVLPTNNKR